MKLLVLGDFQGTFSDKLMKKLKKEEFDVIIGVGDYGGISDWRPWVMQNLKDARKGKEYLTAEEYFGKKRLKLLIKKDMGATRIVFKKIEYFGKPFISVFGNGDDGWYKYPFVSHMPKLEKRNAAFLKKLKNFKDITYKQTKINKINFIGFGGYMDIEAYLDKKVFPESAEKEKYFARLNRLKSSRKQLFKRLKKIKGEKIFVFHYPSLGAFDIIRDKKDNPMNGKSSGVRFFKEIIKKYKPKLVLCGHMHEYQGVKKIDSTFIINPGDAEKGKYTVVDIQDKKIKVKFIK